MHEHPLPPQVSLCTSLCTFLLGFFSFLDNDDPYVTSGVKVVVSVLALLVNVAFVVYICYLLCRNQGVQAKDAPQSFASVDSKPHTRIHSESDGVVVHVQRGLEKTGVLDEAPPSTLHSKREQALQDMVAESNRDRSSISFEEGMRVLIVKDDDTTYTAVTAARSRHVYTHVVPVVDKEDPSGFVEVLCARVRPMEIKEEGMHIHTHARLAKQALNGNFERVGVISLVDTDDEPSANHDTTHAHHTLQAIDTPLSLPSLLPFARPTDL
jgi:hypothetical protein